MTLRQSTIILIAVVTWQCKSTAPNSHLKDIDPATTADANAAADPTASVTDLNPDAADVDISEEGPPKSRDLVPAGIGPVAAAAQVATPPFCYRKPFVLKQSTGTSAFDNSYWMAVTAKLAYVDEQELRATLAQNYDVSYVHYFEASSAFGGYDSQAYMAEIEIPIGNGATQKIAILSFRGTKEKIDFFTDARAIPTTAYASKADGTPNKANPLGHVHSGFNAALNGMWPQIFSAVKAFKGPIWITGHSLGGALATLAAGRLMASVPGIDIQGVFSFGSPRVGGYDYLQKYKQLSGAKTKTYRFVNADDMVAVVPSTPIPPYIPAWWHVGDLFWFDHEGNFYSDAAAAERASTTVWTKALSLFWVSDHYLTSYLPKLEKHFYGNVSTCDE